MMNIALFCTATFIWGSTWLAIKLQLSQVPAMLSVSYRFALASLILFAFCFLRKRTLQFTRADHFRFFLMGLVYFGLNYCITYKATGFLTSGLVAVVFSAIMLMNIINLRIFLKQPVQIRALYGGLIGFFGICLLFWHDLTGFSLDLDGITGFALGLAAAYVTSLGNMVATVNHNKGVPVTQSNAFGMGYGALIVMILWLLGGGGLSFDTSMNYVGPLLYLAVMGSVVTFGAFVTLIGRIGSEYASYVGLVSPVIALLFSTLFESYIWTPLAVSGVGAILIGNFIVLTPRKKIKRMLGGLKRAAPLPGPPA